MKITCKFELETASQLHRLNLLMASLKFDRPAVVEMLKILPESVDFSGTDRSDILTVVTRDLILEIANSFEGSPERIFWQLAIQNRRDALRTAYAAMEYFITDSGTDDKDKNLIEVQSWYQFLRFARHYGSHGNPVMSRLHNPVSFLKCTITPGMHVTEIKIDDYTIHELFVTMIKFMSEKLPHLYTKVKWEH